MGRPSLSQCTLDCRCAPTMNKARIDTYCIIFYRRFCASSARCARCAPRSHAVRSKRHITPWWVLVSLLYGFEMSMASQQALVQVSV